MAYRSMSPQLAIKQFQSLFEYSDRSKFFNCVDNIMPRSYVKEVFPYIETPGSATIFYEVKADLSAEDLQILSNANVNRIQPGIESLATSTLKLMKKGTSAFQNIMLLKNCATYKIQPDWNLLVGFPGEQEQVYQKYLRDIPLLTHLPPPSGTFPVRFDRYSPYFVRAKEYGLNLHYVDHYNLTYPFAEESLANLAYYFADRSGDAEYFRAMTKWIGKVREKVDAWKDCWEKLPPTLHYEEHDHRRFIVDTRSGSRVEFELSQPGQQLLDLLSAPRRRTDLVSSLKIEVDRELDWLLGNGLLFEEDERFLNLVLPEPGRRH
jgi:ribosomal peptide maturation radical SAM protein 1